MFLTLCTAAVVGRVVARRMVKARLMVDDYLAFAALVRFPQDKARVHYADYLQTLLVVLSINQFLRMSQCPFHRRERSDNAQFAHTSSPSQKQHQPIPSSYKIFQRHAPRLLSLHHLANNTTARNSLPNILHPPHNPGPGLRPLPLPTRDNPAQPSLRVGLVHRDVLLLRLLHRIARNISLSMRWEGALDALAAAGEMCDETRRPGCYGVYECGIGFFSAASAYEDGLDVAVAC